MAATVVQSKAAAQNTGLATVTASWDTAATAGNLLLLIVGSDDYRATSGPSRPESSGFTLSAGCAQQTFLGHYVWWKVAAGGETSVSYKLNSAATSCWITAEVSGVEASPYDVSNGQFAQSSGTTYTTPTVTPSSGERLLVASIGGSYGSAGLTDLTSWLNGFVEVRDVATVLASGTRDIIGLATASVSADGSAGYSSGATYNATPQSRTGIILSFRVAAASGTTHTASASGASTSGGTAAFTLRLAASASGGSTSGGSAAATIASGAVVHAVSGSGASSSAGSAAAGLLLVVSASGGSASSGSAAALLVGAGPVTHVAAGSGGSTSAGSAAVTLRLVAAAAGASTSSGSAAAALLLVAAASGGSTSAGSAAGVVFGQVVTRPYTGTTVQPTSGTTARPFTGVTTY